MIEFFTELVVRPAADAFLQVGVWVAIMLAVFSILQWWTGGRLEQFLIDHVRLGPLFGGLLGMTPGCGGAIIVMPLYTRGTVSFGTVVAALAATMGDSSFVILAAAPGTGLTLHGILVVTGLVVGYVVDAFGISPSVADLKSMKTSSAGSCSAPALRPGVTGAPSTVGAAAAETDITGRRLAYRFPSPGMLGFWGLVLAGLVVSVLVVFRIISEATLAGWLGGLNGYLIVGGVGTLATAGLSIASGTGLGDDTAESIAEKTASLRSALRHAARETAFVTVWVALAFYAYYWFEAGTGMDLAQLPALGIAGVIVGALIGLIPGCGPQIVLTTLYAQGGVGFPALLANAVSQDGDALFPLLAKDTRSAATATVITTLPALVVGSVALVIVS